MKYAWQKVKKGDKIFYRSGEGIKEATAKGKYPSGLVGLILLEDGSYLFSGDIVRIIRDKKEIL